MSDNPTKTKKVTFFENYDLYSDANPKDTISIKYKSLDDVKNTIKKLEKLYNKNTISHSRNSQIANVMTQRLRVIDLDDKRTKLSKKYFEFLKKRTKIKDDVNRKKLKFKI